MLPRGVFPVSFQGPPPPDPRTYQAAGPPTAWASTPSYQGSSSSNPSSYPAYDNNYYGNSSQQSYGHSQSGQNYGVQQQSFGDQQQFNSSQVNPQNNVGVSGITQVNYAQPQFSASMGNLNSNNGYPYQGTQTSDQGMQESYGINATRRRANPYFDPRSQQANKSYFDRRIHVKMNQADGSVYRQINFVTPPNDMATSSGKQSFPQSNGLQPTQQQNQSYAKQQFQNDGFSKYTFPSKPFNDANANQISSVPMSFDSNNGHIQQNLGPAQSANQWCSSTAQINYALPFSAATNQITGLQAPGVSAAHQRNPVNPILSQVTKPAPVTVSTARDIQAPPVNPSAQNIASQQSTGQASSLFAAHQINPVAPIPVSNTQSTKAPIFTQPTAHGNQAPQVHVQAQNSTSQQTSVVPAGANPACWPAVSKSPPLVGLLSPPKVLAWSRPAYSYASLICMAILATPGHQATLKEICQYIEQRFPYYRRATVNWRASIRQNLTVNDCFYKTRRRRGDTGCPWALDPAYSDMFDKGSQLRRGYRYKEGSVRYAKSKEESRKKAEKKKLKKRTMQGGSMQTEESQDSQTSTDVLMSASSSTVNEANATDNNDQHQRSSRASPAMTSNNDKHPPKAADTVNTSNCAPRSSPQGFGSQQLAGHDTACALSTELQNTSYGHLFACLPDVPPAMGTSSPLPVSGSEKAVKNAEDTSAIRAQLDLSRDPEELSKAYVSPLQPGQSAPSKARVANSQSGLSDSSNDRLPSSRVDTSQDSVQQPSATGCKTKPTHNKIQDMHQHVHIVSLSHIPDEVKLDGVVISIPDKPISPTKPPKKNKSGHKNSKNAKRSQKTSSKNVVEARSSTATDTKTARDIEVVQPSTHKEGLLAAGQSSTAFIDNDDRDPNTAVGPAAIEMLLKNTLGDGYVDPVEPQGATGGVVATSQTSKTASNNTINPSAADSDIETSDNFTQGGMDLVLGCNDGQVKYTGSCAQSGLHINGVFDSANKTADQDSNRSSLSTSGSEDPLQVSNTSDLGMSVLSPASDQQQTDKCANDTDVNRSSSILLTPDSGDLQTSTSNDLKASTPGQSEPSNAPSGQSSKPCVSMMAEASTSDDSQSSNKENSSTPLTYQYHGKKNNSISLFSDVSVYGALDFNDMNMDWDFPMGESTHTNDSGVNLSLNLD